MSKIVAKFIGITEITETVVLSGTDITNKYFDLAHAPLVPANVTMFVKGSGPQVNGATYDFQLITNGSDIRRLSWSTLALDGVLVAADVLVIQYAYSSP